MEREQRGRQPTQRFSKNDLEKQSQNQNPDPEALDRFRKAGRAAAIAVLKAAERTGQFGHKVIEDKDVQDREDDVETAAKRLWR
jgi:hypothetical protein